jgi:excisionase family DNA binding protein
MTQTTTPEPLVDLRTVADFLCVTSATLRKWRERGEMPFPVYAIGRALRFKLSEVDAYVQAQSHGNPVEARRLAA